MQTIPYTFSVVTLLWKRKDNFVLQNAVTQEMETKVDFFQ